MEKFNFKLLAGVKTKKLFCVNSSKQQIDFKFVFEYNFFNSSI